MQSAGRELGDRGHLKLQPCDGKIRRVLTDLKGAQAAAGHLERGGPGRHQAVVLGGRGPGCVRILEWWLSGAAVFRLCMAVKGSASTDFSLGNSFNKGRATCLTQWGGCAPLPTAVRRSWRVLELWRGLGGVSEWATASGG